MDKETIIQEIIHANLQTLYNLIEPIKEENEELNKAYRILKKGRKLHYHIEWNLKGHAEIRDRQGIAVINGKEYDIEEWWDEEEERRAAARKALMNYYLEEDKPYEQR